VSYRILEGDASARLRELESESVQTCITSPPYWGLRDYGTAIWDGGDPECDHVAPRRGGPVSASTLGPPGQQGGEWHERTFEATQEQYRNTCGKCGATRIDSQLGLESTPEQYVENLVEVFREVRRVLRDDGTVWINLGDSYAANRPYQVSQTCNPNHDFKTSGSATVPAGMKPKDLVGIPWMVAFALRADGWYLRSDIIWAKPNPMPESVTDRPTKSHEYLFLLTKSPRYYYDADAIREEATMTPQNRLTSGENWKNGGGPHRRPDGATNPTARNKRSVWTVTTQPFPGAHFATFPPKLIEPCVLAGSRPHGAMIEPETVATPLAPDGERIDPTPHTGRKGMNRERINGEGIRPITVAEQRAYAEQLRLSPHRTAMETEAGSAFAHYLRTDANGARPIPPDLLEAWTERNWLIAVEAPEASRADPSTSVVLDPFCGSGTTGVVALRHDRSFVGIELNPEYAQMARNRIYDDAPLLNVEVA
jgi:DNA modification methylase